MSVKIIIDSAADVVPSLNGKFPVVPMVINFGTDEYIDGIDITHEEFYDKLVSSDVTPTTSQATPDRFMTAFDKIKEAGDSAVVLTLASKFSGTYQSAMIAAADYDDIHIVDSGSVTIGIGVLASYALSLVEKGMTAKEIAEEIESVKDKVSVVAVVDTLEYLKRGGRLSKTAAIAGGLLNIKPLISIEDGAINVIGKARGIKAATNQLLTEIEKVGGVDFSMPYVLAYTGNDDTNLNNFIEDNKDFWQGFEKSNHATVIGSVIGTHAGPGAVATAFFKK